MTIESILKEVEPILQGREFAQFSHPSFREVLAAKQCAEEINSGRLSVKQASNFWLYDPTWDSVAAQDNSGYCDDLPYGCYFEPKGLRSEWRPALAHLAGMLNEDKAKEFVDIVGEFHKDNISSIIRKPSIHGRSVVLEDFALCARFIGLHPALHCSERVDQILGYLVSVAIRFGGNQGEEYIDNRARLANRALRWTKSKKVAEDLLNFVQWCGPIMDYGYPTDDARLSARDDVSETIHALGDSGVEIEDILLKNLYKGMDLCEGFEPIVGLMGYFGGKASLEMLTTRLLYHNVLQRLSWGDRSRQNYSVAIEQCSNHFHSIFSIIKRRGFDPELIMQFNKRITEAQSGPLMAEYHSALSSFAEKFKEESGLDLYTHLEKNKMQFWDYWMVYKPK